MRISLIQRLKHCAKIMERSKNTLKQLDQMQLMFIDLAQQVHNIHATVDYETSEVDEPPFDGYHYIWNLELEWHHHPLLWLKLLLPYYL